jgi:putative oxidoreductase
VTGSCVTLRQGAFDSWRALGMVGFGTRVVVGTVFLAAGISKIQYPYEFLSSVSAYRLLNPEQCLLVARYLPWAEVSVGAFLVSGFFLSGTYVVATALALAFAGAKTWAVHFEIPIGCGCMSNGPPRLVGIQDVLLAVCLLVAITFAWTIQSARLKSNLSARAF